MRKLGLVMLLFVGSTAGVQSADIITEPMVSSYCAVAENAQLLYIEDDARLTTEVVRLMDEAIVVAGDQRWIYSSRPAFVWASEAKVACGKAYGYLKSSYRDTDYLNKCECFHARMVQYMN